MGLDQQGKLDILAAQRGPLEHELFAVELELDVKEEGVLHGATGVTQEMVEEVKARRDGIAAEIKVIDDRKERVDLEEDEDA
jgi:hypothetical protein